MVSSEPAHPRPTLLLDQQLYGLADSLKLLGWTTTRRTASTQVLVLVNEARKEGLLILTRDKDLVRKCEFAGVPCRLVEASGPVGDVARGLDKSLREQFPL